MTEGGAPIWNSAHYGAVDIKPQLKSSWGLLQLMPHLSSTIRAVSKWRKGYEGFDAVASQICFAMLSIHTESSWKNPKSSDRMCPCTCSIPRLIPLVSDLNRGEQNQLQHRDSGKNDSPEMFRQKRAKCATASGHSWQINSRTHFSPKSLAVHDRSPLHTMAASVGKIK